MADVKELRSMIDAQWKEIAALRRDLATLKSLARGPKGEDGRDGRDGKDGKDAKPLRARRPSQWVFDTDEQGRTVATPVDMQ